MKNGLLALVIMLALTVVSFAGEKKAEIKIDGMTCGNCVSKVKTALEKTTGVKSADVSLETNTAVVVYDDSKTDEASLKKAVNSTGFKVVDAEKSGKKKGTCCKEASTCCGKKS